MLNIAIAPIIILLFYIYVRDKYEKEPYMMLIIGIIIGAIITPVIFFIEDTLMNINNAQGEISQSLYIAFVVAALTEELVKFIFVYALAYRNEEFNEPFDGIVYSTFIALGFAMIENIMYVTNSEIGGITTGIARSITSVPVHAMYGIIMGYYLGKAKFAHNKKEKYKSMFKAITVPILFHGIYDWVLIFPILSGTYIFLIVIIVLLHLSYRMMIQNLKKSPFKKKYNYDKYRELSNEFNTFNER